MSAKKLIQSLPALYSAVSKIFDINQVETIELDVSLLNREILYRQLYHSKRCGDSITRLVLYDSDGLLISDRGYIKDFYKQGDSQFPMILLFTQEKSGKIEYARITLLIDTSELNDVI